MWVIMMRREGHMTIRIWLLMVYTGLFAKGIGSEYFTTCMYIYIIIYM